jgi:hypothetical protein
MDLTPLYPLRSLDNSVSKSGILIILSISDFRFKSKVETVADVGVSWHDAPQSSPLLAVASVIREAPSGTAHIFVRPVVRPVNARVGVSFAIPQVIGWFPPCK